MRVLRRSDKQEPTGGKDGRERYSQYHVDADIESYSEWAVFHCFSPVIN